MLLLLSSCNKESFTILHELINQEDNMVAVFMPDHDGVFKLEGEDNQNRIIPILLNFSNLSDVEKIIPVLPHIHHIINFDGQSFEEIVKRFRKTYRPRKISGASEDVAKSIQDVVNSLPSRGNLFNVTQTQTQYQNQITQDQKANRTLTRSLSTRFIKSAFRTLSFRRKINVGVKDSSSIQGARQLKPLYDPPGSFRRTSSSSSECTFRGSMMAGDPYDDRNKELLQKLKLLFRNWENQIHENEKKLDELNSEKHLELDERLADFSQKVHEGVCEELKINEANFKEDKISKCVAAENITMFKQNASKKEEEFRNKGEEEIKAEMILVKEIENGKLYRNFIDSEIKLLKKYKEELLLKN